MKLLLRLRYELRFKSKTASIRTTDSVNPHRNHARARTHRLDVEQILRRGRAPYLPGPRHRALRAPNTSPHKTENAAEHHRSSAPYAAPHVGSGGPLSQPAGQRATHWSLSRPATLPTLQTPPPWRFRASAGARLAAAPSARSRREPWPPLAPCSTHTHTHSRSYTSAAPITPPSPNVHTKSLGVEPC